MVGKFPIILIGQRNGADVLVRGVEKFGYIVTVCIFHSGSGQRKERDHCIAKE